MSRRVPTLKQMRALAVIASPRNAVLAAGERAPWPSLRQHGWVEAVDDPDSRCIERITPAGLRALADAIEQYGYQAAMGRGA